MRNITFNTSFLQQRLLLATLLLFGFTALAQVQTPFAPRFSDVVNGDFTTIANNTISTSATANYTGVEDNHDVTTVFVDIDNDPTTFNSSSANFSNPVPSSICLTIKKAYIYWAASDKEYDNDTGNGGIEPIWNFDQLKLMLPGSNTYNTITADETIFHGRSNHFVNDPYICVKDITTDLQALDSPFGKFQVANVKGTEGVLSSHLNFNLTGTSGGWQIVIIYEGPELVRRNITIFDGYANVTQDQNQFNVDFNGFQTIANGEVQSKVLIGALEGDRSLDGDGIQLLDTSNNWITLSTYERPADNFFNSKITNNGLPFTDRNPASTNTLGFDAANFELENTNNTLIGNNQTSATMRMISNKETYGLYLMGLSIEVFEPNLGALNFTTKIVGSNFDPGDTAPVEIQIKNVGNDNIRNLEIALPLPAQVEFLNTDPLPPGVTYTYDDTIKELRFVIEDGYSDMDDAEFLLGINLLINEECIDCSATISLQSLATFTGEINPNMVGTLSSGTLNSCGLGNHDPTYLYVKPVLTISDASAIEGENLNFNVTSSHLLSEEAILNFTYNNITAIDTDYTSLSSFTLPIGTGSTSISIPTVEDVIVEKTETFELIASTTANLTFIDNTAVGEIIDKLAITVEPYQEQMTIVCGEDIPEVPDLVFDGGCSDLVIDFNETEQATPESEDFTIIRTWKVTDSCNTTTIFEQLIFVTQTEKELVTIDICIDDETIDLLDFLPTGFDKTGSFTSTEEVILDDTMFDPSKHKMGEYLVSYTSENTSCKFYVDFTINVNNECVFCSVLNMEVSKTITVNGDGINDVFEITGLETCGYTFQLMVFNRWGTKVYESNDYQNNWGGTAPSSSVGNSGILPTGTYYYMITIVGSEIEPVNGYIYLGSN